MTLKRYKQITAGVFGLWLASLFVTLFGLISVFRTHTVVSVLDVGQGDSILITTRAHQHILIDGGPDASVLSALGRELPFFARSIDVVIATHPDADHISGLPAVLERYHVPLVIHPGIAHDSAVYKTFLETVSARAVSVHYADGPIDLVLDDETKLRILYPLTSFVGQDVEDNNDVSVVAQFDYAGLRVLLTGDASVAVENTLIAHYGGSLKSDVLKFGHHGSDTSSGEIFLDAVAPEFGIFSVGARNRYNHPSYRIVRRVEQFGIPFLRTDLHGTVRLVFDNEHIIVE